MSEGRRKSRWWWVWKDLSFNFSKYLPLVAAAIIAATAFQWGRQVATQQIIGHWFDGLTQERRDCLRRCGNTPGVR